MNKFKAISKQIFMAMVMSLVAAPAFGQSNFIGNIFLDPWVNGLITAALAIKTLLVIYDKWDRIFQGEEVLKNAAHIAAWIILTVWWDALLAAIIVMDFNGINVK